MSEVDKTSEIKQRLRAQLRQSRREQEHKDALSKKLFEKLVGVRQFSETETRLFYIDVRDEVRTQSAIQDRFDKSQSVIVPFCDDNDLRLVELRDFAELEPGAYGILEPTDALKANLLRRVDPADVGVALIPGLGFETTGGRIGHGKGYYDRLLPNLSRNCVRIGIAYDCQIVDHIPLESHDQKMDLIVTPSQVIHCRHVDS